MHSYDSFVYLFDDGDEVIAQLLCSYVPNAPRFGPRLVPFRPVPITAAELLVSEARHARRREHQNAAFLVYSVSFPATEGHGRTSEGIN